ncbi:MAG: LpxL/LpxP family acyltransferase [Panacagrimonas sp.]
MSAAWQAQRERSTPFMLRLLIGLARTLGRSATRLLLFPIVIYFLLTARAARAASAGFLRRALQREPRWSDLARNFHCFASCALDRVFLLSGGMSAVTLRLNLAHEVREFVSHRRGCILLVTHLGSFEVLRVLAAREHGVSIRILMDRAQNPMVTRMLEALAPELAAGVIDAASGGPEVVLALKSALDAGHIVGIMGDRVRARERGATVDFLGGRASLPQGPWIMAGALGVPVLLGFGLYRGGRCYDVHLEMFAERLELPRGKREAALQDCAQAYARRIEHYARLAPYNWFNFYPYWNDDAPAAT